MKNLLHIIYFFSFALGFQLNADEMYFQVLRDTGLYTNGENLAENVTSQTLKKGEKLILSDRNSPFFIASDKNWKNPVIAGRFYYDDSEYNIIANYVTPWGTENNFDPSLITDLNSFDRKTLIMAYNTDILASEKRETVFQYAPYWSNPKNRDFLTPAGDALLPWYEVFHNYWPGFDSLNISNSALRICIQWIALKNIKNIENGYVITGRLASDYWKRSNRKGPLDFTPVADKEFFDIIMKIDGDYIDCYLEDEFHILATMVSVDQEFITQLDNLIQTNTCDLSNITWPTRADGSTDYPIPEPVVAEPEPTPEDAAVNTEPEPPQAVEEPKEIETVSAPASKDIPLAGIIGGIAGAIVLAGAVVWIARKKKG